MRSLWLLTLKNLKLLMRSKGSALIVIIAPLLIMLILGLSYNTTGQYGLSVGVHAPSFTDDVNSFITLLEEDGFSVAKYDSSIESCTDDIKRGVMHTCISLPESLQVNSDQAKDIRFFVDESRINLVWMVQQSVQSKFDLKAKEISQGLTQGLLARLSTTRNTLNEKKAEIQAVKDKASSVSSSASTSKAGLDALDVTPPSVMNATTIENISTDLTSASLDIDEAISLIDELSVNSSEKDEITALLTNAQDDMAANTTAGLIKQLQNDLDISIAKLNTAASTISSTSENLGATTTALAESIASLDSVLAALDTITSDIDSQPVKEAGVITSPLTVNIETVQEKSTYLNYLLPALLVLVVMFSSLLLGTTLVMMEKNSPAFVRNFFLPIKKATFIFSVYITNMILILIEVAIILAISLFFLPNIMSAIPSMLLVLFLTASVFTFLGMVVGYIFTSEETGVLASVSLGSILLFLSGVILPLEGIAISLRKITFFNPFVISQELIREVFFFGASLGDVWIDLVMLAVYAVFLFVVILVLESLLHKHLVQRFLHHHHRAHRQKDKKDKGGA